MIPETIPIKVLKTGSISLVTFGTEEELKEFKRALVSLAPGGIQMSMRVEDNTNWRASIHVNGIPVHVRQRVANHILASSLVFFENPHLARTTNIPAREVTPRESSASVSN